ncbi:MAG: isoprenylcysteine carboxylmethyltransferase family protein [Mesorhizobium sp.]
MTVLLQTGKRERGINGLTSYQRTRRYVIGAMLFLLAGLLMFVSSSQPELTHAHIEGFGLALMLIGIGGRLWSILYIGGRKSAEVVDIGPYSMTRNPLYFFSAVAAAGVGAQIGSWVMAIIFGVLCWAAFTVVIRREEKFLASELGQTFRDYLASTPRFFPNPLLYRDRPEVTFKPSVWNRTLMDGLVFVLAVPIFEAIEYGQQTGFLPILLHLP